jgi:hypothetical protein
MKKLQLFSGAVILLLIMPAVAFTQANRRLSNLIAPTQINTHLWPRASCTYDIGANAWKWRYGYFCRGIGISPNNVVPSYPLDILNRDYSIGARVVNTNYVTNVNRIGVYSYSVSSGSPGFGYGVQTSGGRVGAYAINSSGSYAGTTYGVYSFTSGTAGVRYGVYSTATGTTGARYGVYGEASSSGGSRYGVYGYACSGTNEFSAGVYGRSCSNTSPHWAGYFVGRVFSTGGYVASDRKLKTGIAPLKNSVEQLMKLKPSVYHFKTEQYGKMALPMGNQMGLIADEVKKVFPELVTEVVSPAEYNEDGAIKSAEDKFDAVNYDGLIPVIIASLQEQQKTIADLKTENDELKSRLTKLEQELTLLDAPGKTVKYLTLSDARLTQNNPNPFNKSTIINYYLPDRLGNAVMNISDMNGRVIKSTILTKKGNGQLILEAGQLSAGTYQYSLLVGGKLVDTKKMVLTKQ